MNETDADLIAAVRRVVRDYDGRTYAELQSEISDDFTGETGDLIREHAWFVLAIRAMGGA